MALFPVSRYMGEEEEDGEIKTVMTLEELYSIAQDRIKTKQIIHTKKEKVEEEHLTNKVKRKKKVKDKSNDLSVLCDELKRKRKRSVSKHSDKSEEGLDETIVKVKKKNVNQSLPEEEPSQEPVSLPTQEPVSLPTQEPESLPVEEEQQYNDPLPLVTHTVSRKTIPSQSYQLPDWAANRYICIEKDITTYSQPLDSFRLNDVIINNLTKMGITNLFPVQCHVIPELMSSCQGPLLTTLSGTVPSDICVCAPTGCGKTLSYVIPIVSALLSTHKQFLRALVVVPSKDLALQVYKVFMSVSKGTGVRMSVVCGQNNLQVEQNQLVSLLGSEVDVLVATPGRLVTHLQETPFFSLSHLRYLVIDEADRIFDQQYHNWLNHVLQATTKVTPSHSLLTSSIPFLLPSIWRPSLLDKRAASLISSNSSSVHSTVSAQDIFQQSVTPLQKLLFSATLSLDPEHLSLLNLHRPKLFTVAPAIHEQLGETVLPSTLKEHFVECTSEHKPLALLHLVITFGHQRMLCFTHSRESTHRLKLLLQQYEAPVAEISTSLSQEVKNELIKKFKNGQLKVLVCSDGMARGMDIPDVDCVLNYDMPTHFRSYLHRVGRTARAGNKGVAYTLITHEEVRKCERMMKQVGRKHVIEKISITDDDLKDYVEKYSAALHAIAEIVL